MADRYTVIRNGAEIEVEANSPEEAAEKAKQGEAAMVPNLPLAERLQRGRAASATGIRGGIEGTAGIVGDAPAMAGGVAEYATKQVGRLPFGIGEALVGPETPGKVGGMVSTATEGALTPMSLIARKLQEAGMIPEQVGEAMQPPTSQDIHAATTSVLPEGVNDYTSFQPATTGEKAAQLTGEFLPNLLTGGGSSAARAVGGRVIAPVAAVTGADIVADELVSRNIIAPEMATAIKLVAGFAGGTAGAKVEKTGDIAAAAATINKSPQAIRAVQQGLENDGYTTTDALTKMREMGVLATPMDLGPNMLQLGQKAATTPGPGKSAVLDALLEREKGAGPRAHAAREGALGPSVNRDALQQEFKDRAKALGPEYEAAHAGQTQPVQTQTILDDIDTDLAKVKTPEVVSKLEEVRRSLHLKGTDQLDPSTEGLHEARKAIDNALYDSKGVPRDLGGQTAGILNKYRAQIDEALGEAGPIKDVDAKRAAIGKEERAFGMGEDVLTKGKEAKSPAEFGDAWNTMTEPERAQAVSGASRYVDSQIGLTDRERQKLKTIFGGDWNEAKLRTMIGDEKTDAFMHAMETEDTFRNTFNKLQGSRTADIMEHGGQPGLGAGMVENAGATLVGSGGNLMAAGGAAAATGARNWLNRQKNTAMPPEIKSQIGEMLASNRPDDVFRAVDLLAKADKRRVVPQGVLAALLARQEALGNR